MTTLLLIEDDNVLRENTSEILELSNYRVITASNGQIGLEMAKKQRPDLIICDIMMPVLDGYGVLKGLSQDNETKFIPFIFLSAKSERHDIRKGMNLGADDYLTKPFNEEEIVSAIESRLAKVSILKEEQALVKTTLDSDMAESLHGLKAVFEAHGEVSSFQKNDVIYQEGQHSNTIYYVLEGIVKCYRFDENGKELITALQKKDHLFGYTSFSQNIPYRETATVISDAKTLSISKSELDSILSNHHALTLEVIQLLTDDLIETKDQLLQMAYSSVQRKTAATILRFAEKINTKPEDPIRISRNDLASVAGIATETLIRTMSEFKRQGLIEMEGRNIKVLNLKKLQDIQ
ncbi:response regulator [Sediminibacter sp. Hel_I_10]|uniref:response regulator n=1 Tax=Sediminibacter sp. Hel_I_10 TaxID=1392490 RepID=UPI00047C6FBB|nr:response regulator [Sediminibacter sp. Hel_I_10]